MPSCQSGGTTIFESGGLDAEGRLRGIADEFAIPHVDVVDDVEDVPVYEMVASDASGHPTTLLTNMATRGKDTRLLPAGWRPDGPFAADTAPVGVTGDSDFRPGGDVVHYRIPIDTDAPPARITVWLWYQSVPPAWVDPMRAIAAPETDRFVRLYDAMYDAGMAMPEPIGVAVEVE